jgi:hypothetical protein
VLNDVRDTPARCATSALVAGAPVDLFIVNLRAGC